MDGLGAEFARLDLTRLRVRKPSKTVFLCGGRIGEPSQRKVLSVRDFLVRHRATFRTIRCNVALAENATQLYRDSRFKDLISFEEEIAQISAVVLVIAESPGALAELGAFTLSEAISPNLKAIVNQRFETDESFIRHGPLRRLDRENEGSVSYYPWHETKSTFLPTKRSLSLVYKDMKETIHTYIKSSPETLKYADIGQSGIHYIVYWIIRVSVAIPHAKIIGAIQAILPKTSESDIINSIYVLRMVGWISKQAYGPYSYYYSNFDEDSLSYAFTAQHDDSARFVSDIATLLKETVAAPKTMLERAIEARS